MQPHMRGLRDFSQGVLHLFTWSPNKLWKSNFRYLTYGNRGKNLTVYLIFIILYIPAEHQRKKYISCVTFVIQLLEAGVLVRKLSQLKPLS